MYLFHEDGHHGLDTLIYERLYVLYCLLLVQVQTELVLDLGGEGGREGRNGREGEREGGKEGGREGGREGREKEEA